VCLLGGNILMNNELISKLVICPFCGSEAWEIGAEYFKCFLCKRSFFPKDLIVKKNVYSINMNLKFIKDVGDFQEGL